MGTRSVVGTPNRDGGWRGRYIHWDGYPAGVGCALLKIRHDLFPDDLPAMIEHLTVTHTGWSTLTGETPEPDRYTLSVGNHGAVAVPGCGVAYIEPEAEAWWIESDGDNGGTEWCYLLLPRGIEVLEAVRDGGHATGWFGSNYGADWTLRGSVPWEPYEDADEQMRKLG